MSIKYMSIKEAEEIRVNVKTRLHEAMMKAVNEGVTPIEGKGYEFGSDGNIIGLCILAVLTRADGSSQYERYTSTAATLLDIDMANVLMLRDGWDNTQSVGPWARLGQELRAEFNPISVIELQDRKALEKRAGAAR